MQKPRKGYLYTWNFVDGQYGEPSRKIALAGLSPSLLEVAYLGGGPRWDGKGTESGALLCLILVGSARQQQNASDYYRFFEHYPKDRLAHVAGGKVDNLSGSGRAEWSVEVASVGWSASKIDKFIQKVLRWHSKQIEILRSAKDRRGPAVQAK